ncbi:MAG: large-conductance mechanosensitive channel protein MscL [Bacilli bacterium]|nr:large-conductance mechanosensitive channel protein MscL [Bacilli bacterium]
MIDEFKNFISRGNVVDMAVGVIIGGAFGKIVTSLVNDILMPLVGILIGGHDFSTLAIKVGDASILYGAFIQAVIDFLIVAICIFFMVKTFEKLKKKKPEVVETPKEDSDEVKLLKEIRDLLKKKK